MDPEVVSVGIVALPGGFGFGVRLFRGFSDTSVVPLHRCDRVATIRGIPLVVHHMDAPIVPLLELPSAAANGPSLASLPEQRRQRPLRPGVQLQNWDADARAGLLTSERITVGTLGMVLAHDDGALLLSNNHVLAGQNRGCIGDRIAQPGGVQIGEAEVVARLERFVPLQVSPIGARPGLGVIWNQVDAAVARLRASVDWRASFLDVHALPSPSRYAGPVLGERVFKVGRTTGLRWGVITSVGVRVGPIPYAIGGCWFRGSFMIEGEGGRPFSDGGDSGAIVVRRSGEVIGMIYAGNGAETLACPISDVLAAIV
ncbi:MAG TPA: hypothetical protein VM869_06145 [Enhygromyxa sp.]|nr:hypothetical protein [Enhygromyxa sp.]